MVLFYVVVVLLEGLTLWLLKMKKVWPKMNIMWKRTTTM